MRKLLSCLVIAIIALLPLYAFAGPATDTVKTNVSSVIDILRDPKLKGDAGKKQKEQKIEVVADKMFDYVELSKQTLGLNWNKFSADQRKEFVSLFKNMLRNTYIDRITAYTNEKVNYGKEVPLAENKLEVQTVIISSSGQIPINYRVMKKGQDWRVYDVVIEGVSLVSNYRTQFRDILANNPPQVLIDTLRKKAGK
ncbi:MAG: MlaC/ttg2D family ABC transporter substrate-binding protein [Syntrophorhabdaceae bacterium]